PTGKWLDGFDATYNPTKFLRFSFWVDGKRVDAKSILLGRGLRPAAFPIFYWLDKPAPAKWPLVDGFPSVRAGSGDSFWIGVADDGYWFVKVTTGSKGDADVKFTGNLTAQDGRVDLVEGLAKE